MPRLVKANDATATHRRAYFDVRLSADGLSPAPSEAGEQPQVSVNGTTWTDTGIGVLVAIGQGRYYADLTQSLIATAGDAIETRYKGGSTAETPGDSFQVVGFDPAVAFEEAVFARVVEGTTTFEQSVRLANAGHGAKTSGMDIGSPRIRNLADTKDRIVATTNATGRTNVTLDLT